MRQKSKDKHLYDFRAGVLLRIIPVDGPAVLSFKVRGIYIHQPTGRARIKWGNKPLEIVEAPGKHGNYQYRYVLEMSMAEYSELKLFRYSVPRGWKWDGQKHRLMRVMNHGKRNKNSSSA